MLPRDKLLACFPRSAWYAAGATERADRVRESATRRRAFSYTERHLHCVWLDPRHRPATLFTADGDAVTVRDPGIWNLEAGPDFLGAALELGPERRRVHGDVEIHIHPADWRNHHHHEDARYRRVIGHVTYFPGRVPTGLLPRGALEIALQPALALHPAFSFESIDVTAYPYGERAAVPPCSEVLQSWTPDERMALLDAAGEERLHRKAERLALAIEERGEEQILYEEICSALGYKHNKTPFRRLAEIVPCVTLREEAGQDPVSAYALLLGVAGLLPEDNPPTWDRETRRFVRTLWDHWWKRRGRWDARRLPAGVWRLAGVRPANHPVRRLMAAAALFSSPFDPRRSWSGDDPAAFIEEAQRRLRRLPGAYWERRLTWGGKRQARAVSLIGPDRARSILVNVFVPWLAVSPRQPSHFERLWRNLPEDADNQVVRQAAFFLFGPDHSAKIYRHAPRRQGLMQIFHDYCIHDRTRCAACPFPDWLRAQKRPPASP